jgi:prolyl-tRNA synthetase
VKFKDADLVGIPYRVTLGKKLAQGLAELTSRRDRQARDVSVDKIGALLKEAIRG